MDMNDQLSSKRSCPDTADESIDHPVQKRLITSDMQATPVFMNQAKYPNGEMYQGLMVGGKRQGYGKYFYNTGSLMYEGEFSANARTGPGAFFDKAGIKRFEGEWKHNKGNGSGKLFDKNGKTLYTGEFAQGKFEGLGKSFTQIACPNCQNSFKGIGFIDYIGEFKNGAKTGNGRFYHHNGKMKLEEKVETSEGMKKGFHMVKDKCGEITDYRDFELKFISTKSK
jgi:antitoxin component YwqK of YwqJK toxin-antitoxin module